MSREISTPRISAALLALVLVTGSLIASGMAPAESSMEDDKKLELPLNDWIPNLFLGKRGLIGVDIALDFGNWFVDPARLSFGVEKFDIGADLDILGLEISLIGLYPIPEIIVTLWPTSLVGTILQSRRIMNWIPYTVLNGSFSLLPPSLLFEIRDYPLMPLLPYIGGFIAIFIDILCSTMFGMDVDGLAFSFNIALALLSGKYIVDSIPGICFDIEWPW